MPIRPPYTPPSMPASHPRDFLDYALVREPSLGRLDPAEALALARQVCEELYWMSYQDAATQYEREREDEAAAELAREEAESERDFNENPQWQDAREDARYREEAVAGPPWWAVSQRATLDPDYEYGIQQMAQALVKRLPPYLATLGYPPTANGVILPIDPFSVRIAFQSGEHLQVFVLLRLDIGRDEYTFASCIACAVQTRGGTYLYTAPSEPVEGIYPEEALQDPKRWLNMGLQYPIMLDTPSVKEPVAKALGGLLAPAIPFLARGQGCRLVKEPYMDLHVVPRPDGILIGHVYDNGDPDLFALWPRVSTDGISTKLGERLQFMWVGGRRVPSGPDFSLQRTWLSNLRAYGFAKAKALLLPQTRWMVNRTGPLDVGGVERLSVSEVKGRLKEAYKTNRKARALAGNVVAGGARLLGAPSWAVTTAWAGQKLGDAALDKVMSKVGLYDSEEVERLGATSEKDTIWYHLTDRARFKLDPKFTPADNTFSIEDRSGRPGIYLGQDVGRWVNGYGYWRPFVVEIRVDPTVSQDPRMRGRWGGEMFVPADAFDKLEVLRVIPLDAYAREHYGVPGWVEEATGQEFDTGNPVPRPGINESRWEVYQKYRNYQYPGPDVRQMPKEEVSRLKGQLRAMLAIRKKHA